MDNSTAILDEAPVTTTTNAVNPVVAFIIGLAIILLASILNAAGLNLTKLDHVRTSAIPKAARRKDWLRPLWLLGMLLYILSQLIGSTLALEYMRAGWGHLIAFAFCLPINSVFTEYVAPLGSSSLIFNFLFARFLVGTPVTSTDIYGTIVVILGVIGIVVFGSINSGIASETDVDHLTYLWRRGGWLGYFFVMSFALLLLLTFTSCLDAILIARSEIQALPFAGINSAQRKNARGGSWLETLGVVGKCAIWIKGAGESIVGRITDLLEMWSAPKDDKQVAWTLGIGWACCGGGLAGGTLVFAKATVKLLSGSLSHENPGNQFGHVAPIFTIILLAITAVLQIICLNRGLKVYDSTLVVPVFYGVYTATGFLNSLIFNDEVDAYKSWTLFLIFVSILVLVSGVVLLTHKKPEPPTGKIKSVKPKSSRQRTKLNARKDEVGLVEEGDEREGEDEALWELGEASDEGGEDDDEDADHHQHPYYQEEEALHKSKVNSTEGRKESGEGEGLMRSERRSMDPFRDGELEMDTLKRR